MTVITADELVLMENVIPGEGTDSNRVTIPMKRTEEKKTFRKKMRKEITTLNQETIPMKEEKGFYLLFT